MKFEYEYKPVPTFRTWAINADLSTKVQFDIVRIFCNSEWRTLTFVTELFKVNYKFTTKEEYQTAYKKVKKELGSYCRAYATVNSKDSCTIQLTVASDADEQARKFVEDDFGFTSEGNSI